MVGAAMKLITLWEPWATLMAIGAKKIETRHWGTDYRGWVAIHSAKHWTADEDDLCWTSPFRESLIAAGVPVKPNGCGRKFEFPLGHIIAVTKLVGCKMFASDAGGLDSYGFRMLPPTEPEVSFGNYDEGRYGLLTEGVFKLPDPIPFKSRQGKLLDVPTSLVEAIQQQWKNGRE